MTDVADKPPVWSIASPLAGGALHAAGSGLFHTLLPLRLVADGHGAGIVGLAVGAEGAGFLIGCVFSARLIRSVGEVRAYAALSAIAAILILAFGLPLSIPLVMLILAVLGFVNAGQAVVIESWLNALVSNQGRGRILTLYVLILGLFYGLGQLLARDIDPGGDKMLMVTAGLYAAALVPVTAVWVGELQLHVPVGLNLLRTIRISPIGAFACLLTGLVSSTFASIGPLYGLELAFDQTRIVYLMAAVQLGALFLQFPIGYLSDRLDRRALMIGVALVLAAVCALFLFVGPATPFWLLIVLFSLFGGLSEVLYPLGVAHANDRASPEDFVGLSSHLLLIWAFGGTIGPVVLSAGVAPFGTQIFFWFAIAAALVFAAFGLWRRLQRPKTKIREHFVAYPQTSPAVYEWTPHDAAEQVDGDGQTLENR